jgi:geranylgeranyl pyrophosphate synthase
VLYAASQYRTRGSIDGYQSFESMSVGANTIGLGQVMQLLGTNRPQVG